MVSYVINRRSKIMHKLPASESCNTDQIAAKERFEAYLNELPVLILEGSEFRYCRRCFPDVG